MKSCRELDRDRIVNNRELTFSAAKTSLSTETFSRTDRSKLEPFVSLHEVFIKTPVRTVSVRRNSDGSTSRRANRQSLSYNQDHDQWSPDDCFATGESATRPDAKIRKAPHD